jgi:outer membrane usher protein
VSVKRARIPALAAVLMLACAPMSQAAAGTDDTQQLLLEVWVNGHTSHVIAKVADRDGAFSVNEVDLGAAGVKVNPGEAGSDGYVALAALSGVHVELVGSEQKLLITADKERLAPQLFDLREQPSTGPSSAGTGFIGEYNFAGTVDDFDHIHRSSSIGAELAGTIFTPWATLTADGFAQSQTTGSQLIRLDTTAEFDQPGITRRWLLGDAISGGLSWSRSVRFAGLQMATDFSLQPDLATLPLPNFFGQTAVPATVDVFVNSARVFETDVNPGPFQIDNLPVVTGSGQASIVVRDVLGQETTAVLPFFATNALLREGLSSYDLDAGVLRQAYGLRSFDYGAPAVAGTYRFGATDWLTLEAHSEIAKAVQLAGGGAVFSLGSFGAMQIDGAASRTNEAGERHTGALAALSVNTQSNPFGFFGSVSASTGDYADLATIGGIAPPKLQAQLGANLNLAQNGSLAVSWIEIERDAQAAARLASASYTLSFADSWYLGATSFYDCTNKVWAAEVFLSVAFDGDMIANASLRSGSHANEEEAGLTKSINPDGGFGYRLMASTGDNDIEQAEAIWIGPHGSLDAAVASTDGTLAGRLLASGAVVAMDGSVYATQVPNGAVALVRTGEEGARIFRENREVATADSDGEALITNLVPYTENRISIDPRDYAFSTIVDTTQMSVVPRRMSGVIVDLAPKSHSPILITLHLQDGNPPPIGSPVTLSDGGGPLVVGRDGEVFIADLHGPVKGTVEFGNASCHFAVAPPAVPPVDAIPRIGPLLCAKDETP